MSAKNLVLVQKLEQQNISLKEANSEAKELKETKKQLLSEKSEMVKLKDILSEMKLEWYISADEENLLNVIILYAVCPLISCLQILNYNSCLQKKFLCHQVFEMEEVVECLCKGIKSRESYPPSVLAFCMSLHYLSPRAYEYLREKFAKHLPHSQTLRQWYRNSNLDAISGIGKHALDALEIKSKNMRESGQELVISLIFDEMAIQRNMAWCRASNKFVGLIDLAH